MIRLAFMTDKARVLGATTDAGNAIRLAMLPHGLHAVMQRILSTENVALGRRSYEEFYSSPGMARKDMYLLTQDKNYKPRTAVKLCHNYMELVERFKDSDDELMIPGGQVVLKLFTPYAKIVDVAETTELVPGDLIFDDWDKGDFQLTHTEEWIGGRTLHYTRKK